MRLKVWFLETRPQFLLLSVVLAFLGTSIAFYNGVFHAGYAVLAFLGLLFAHISVNVLNDYFDFRSGVDLKTRRTPFSGGSGILPQTLLTPNQVLGLGLAAFVVSLGIGVFFMVTRGLLLLPVVVIAAICVLLYSPLILKMKWPEWSPGLGLGLLPVLGVYFVQTGNFTTPAIIAAVPSGFLVHNLLLINEFPDVEADKTANRKTLPITMGLKKAGIVYSSVTIGVYVWLLVAVAAKQMPVFSLLGLLTLPFAVKAIRGSMKPDQMDKLVPAMANNVLVVLLTQLFMGIGYIVAGAIS